MVLSPRVMPSRVLAGWIGDSVVAGIPEIQELVSLGTCTNLRLQVSFARFLSTLLDFEQSENGNAAAT